MHPSQKILAEQATNLVAKLAAAPAIWKYTDPELGKVFFLTERVSTIRSPWTGKTFTTRPEKATLSDVGAEIKREKKDLATK